MSTTGEVLAAAQHLVQACTRAGQETLSERETIVFRREGHRWAAVHEHLSPRPGPVPQSAGSGQP
jgi:hypothetical protein